MSAAPSGDPNCAPEQAAPGNSRAHANSASRGRLLENSIPGGWGQPWLLDSSSRTVCLHKAGARGCLHHRKMKFGDTWKPHWMATLLPSTLSQSGCSSRERKTYITRKPMSQAVTKANAAFPQGSYRKTSSTDCVLQNNSFPHAPSFCSQPSSSCLSLPAPNRLWWKAISG